MSCASVVRVVALFVSSHHSINRVCLHMMVHIGCKSRRMISRMSLVPVSVVRVVALFVSSHHSINRVCLYMMVHIGCKTRRMISRMSLVPVSVP